MTDASRDLSPSEFAVLVLGERDLYDWQFEALESIGLQLTGGPPTAVAAANGSGKTAKLVAIALLWFLWRWPKGQGVITSGSFRQVEKQLFPALRVYQDRFPEWTFLGQPEIRSDQGGFLTGFSTTDAGRAEGWHPKISPSVDPVFLVVDEAKTVADPVFEAFERCTRLLQLWTSSPGKPWGTFFDAFHEQSAHFWTRKVRSDECPHIDPAKRERDLERYGIDHPLFRSMHLAEFTVDAERLILPPDALTRAREAMPRPQHQGERAAFCDFAAGGDENVLAVRRSNSVRIVKAWVEKDTMQAAREFVHLFQEEGLQAGEIWGDADGLGAPMIDAIAELGWRINRFHGGSRSTEPETYANLIAEVWHVGAREILRGRIHLDPIDATLFRQLTTRKTEWTESGKLRCESKDKMRADGKASPDRADAVLGAIVCGARMTGAASAKDFAAPSPSASTGFGGGVVTGF